MITEKIRQTIDPMTFLGMEATSKVGLDRIFMIVSEYLGIAPDDMSGKTRKREVADARHIFCYLASKAYGRYTLKQIGRKINRDHASVLHAKKKIVELMDFNKELKEAVDGIIQMLGRFSSEDFVNTKITSVHNGYYNTPKRAKALKLWSENNDPVIKDQIYLREKDL